MSHSVELTNNREVSGIEGAIGCVSIEANPAPLSFTVVLPGPESHRNGLLLLNGDVTAVVTGVAAGVGVGGGGGVGVGLGSGVGLGVVVALPWLPQPIVATHREIIQTRKIQYLFIFFLL